MKELVFLANTIQPRDNNEATITALLNPPTREQSNNQQMFYLADQAMLSSPRSSEVSWEPEDFTHREGLPIHNVRMNSCGVAQFRRFGLLATGNLNGCTAMAASRQEKAIIDTFLGHYDMEAIRQTGNAGNLKITELLANFAGKQAVDVVVAYSKKANQPYAGKGSYAPEDYPLDAIVDACRELHTDSRVLLVPYQTTHDYTGRAEGHMLYAGNGGIGPHFGWNGNMLEVRKDESPEYRARLQQAIGDFEESVGAEDGF